MRVGGTEGGNEKLLGASVLRPGIERCRGAHRPHLRRHFGHWSAITARNGGTSVKVQAHISSTAGRGALADRRGCVRAAVSDARALTPQTGIAAQE
jgi:hypothetical protein